MTYNKMGGVRKGKRGKLIVIYGVNNIGKTTQVKLLQKKLAREGIKAVTCKIPRYRVEPAGTMINEYLRRGNPYKISPREAQLLYALDRSNFRLELEQLLAKGTWVIFEDYWGTGVMWGVARGVSKKFLLRINRDNAKEDAAVFLNGTRFQKGKEKNHLNEHDNRVLEKVRKTGLALARAFGWAIINANQTRKKVADDIWNAVKNTWH